jgi:hypothetical protein
MSLSVVWLVAEHLDHESVGIEEVRGVIVRPEFGKRFRCASNLVATLASPLMDAMHLRSRRNEEGDVV